ncbi:MAG TPA: hypothetical protein VGX23_32200 [Actinocrinis sp.]|nr:hypothetical protein [Actinocrinis sp.]
MVLDTRLLSAERPRRCVFDYVGGPPPEYPLTVGVGEAISLDLHVTGINSGTLTVRRSLFQEGVRGVIRTFFEEQGGQLEIAVLPGGNGIRAIVSFTCRTETNIGVVVSRLREMIESLHRCGPGEEVSLAAAAWVTSVDRFTFPLLRQILQTTGELPPPDLHGLLGAPHLSWG